MAMTAFHPLVREWFESQLGGPTEAQELGWPEIQSGRHTLIAAPTGSGKTLAAFLTAIDCLFTQGLVEGDLPDRTHVVYVSPLKALSADIHANLSKPLNGINDLAREKGLTPPTIRTAVRSGDTSPRDRTAMLKTPPHILVTTPESLYLMLTAERSREMLRTAHTVIVDEIHAVLGTRRGAHLALTLERLEHVAGKPLQRIGLSATQRPIEDVADFLVGPNRRDASGNADCVVVDRGHRREMDLEIEVPSSPLEAVMAHEVWEELYERLAELIRGHRTTLIFVNTRRLAERLAKHLSEKLGEENVTAHHGSLSKDRRLNAEDRLRNGRLQALVATASLELGIDIGHVDLVCQIGSPRWISTLLQRVGRSGHTVRGTPKGRLFPVTRDDLIECAALIGAIDRNELDRLIQMKAPLDVLAQQIVAETACEEWPEEALFELVRRAQPYAELERSRFDEVVQMVAHGFSTRRGRRGALVHYDGVNGRIRGRRAARLTAITAGGAIPDNADYRVVMDPEQTFVGTVNEDFAVESIPGNIFQLGNTAWRILRIESGTVRVADARGEPPTIPFWFGEAPSRSRELSSAVSDLRRDVESRLDNPASTATWLETACHLPPAAAQQIVHYLAEAKHMLGVLPTHQCIVLERFFDESGGMQLVLHAPFGARINRAWGLALRKKFCRQFNFELQAAAVDNAILLSLGPQHSFPLDDVFRYLTPATVRDTLIQAALDSPLFLTRWRWNATLSLAVVRNRAGRRVPPPLQRMQSEDLMAAVFPDAAACLENIGGDREIPDHPLVRQTIDDCLEDAMDLPALEHLLSRIVTGDLQCVSRDTPEPSPLCHEVLNAQPYAFLDDAPLEERRSQAVHTRRALEPSSANELGALDRDAIARVADEAWPLVRDADELHDALLTGGFLTEVEGTNGRGESWVDLFEELAQARRAARVIVSGPEGKRVFWVAAERLGEFLATWTDRPDHTALATLTDATESESALSCDEAIRNLLQSRMELVGAVTVEILSRSSGLPADEVTVALHQLEGQGVVLRGHFTPGTNQQEWCDRRLLARIHRYTIQRLRSEIEPVSLADYMRFLFVWQKVDSEHRVSGVEGLAHVITQLDGFEVPAGAWETDVLSMRVRGYEPHLLDTLSLTGRVAWGRVSPPTRPGGGPYASGPVRSTPVALFLREHAGVWLSLGSADREVELPTDAAGVLNVLTSRGATFFHEIVTESGLLATQVERALGTLVALGFVSSDSFAGLRTLLLPADKRPRLRTQHGGAQRLGSGIETAGRWSVLGRPSKAGITETTIEEQARVLLRRYGIVFRKTLLREANLAPWRELTMVYRRLEARGEIRGGRFVAGASGEQFALPEAVGTLRKVRKEEKAGLLIGISASDPLNLTGVLTPGDRVPSLTVNRIVYRDGVPVAAREGGTVRFLVEASGPEAVEIEAALRRRGVSPALRPYLGKVS
jgi:ATP-dependent Lhr-like helicase